MNEVIKTMREQRAVQNSCAHEETEIDETSYTCGPEGETEVHDFCVKCGKDLGKHEPWTPDTLEEARS